VFARTSGRSGFLEPANERVFVLRSHHPGDKKRLQTKEGTMALRLAETME